MTTILIATGNHHKLKEIRSFFSDSQIELISFKDLKLSSPEESGKSFYENAMIKAKFGFEASGLPTIADDSGLCVEILNGQPGIHSARFAGADATDEENRRKLLNEIDFSQGNIKAYFVCCVVAKLSNDFTLQCEEQWHGEIINFETGDHGFGYDPIFYLKEKQKTAAELSETEKNKISHRGKAFSKILDQLKSSTHGKSY
jgi:XTP/dITP diphosphohydrolase